MSIATKTGDQGTTGLMYNRRVSKSHPRVEAYGCVDELNAAIGLARATAAHDFVRSNLLAIQKELVVRTLGGDRGTLKLRGGVEHRPAEEGYKINMASP